MPAVRIAALVALALAAALAIASAIPGSGVDSAPPLHLLIMMAVVSLKAAVVLRVTRGGAGGDTLRTAGLWLVLAGASCALAVGASGLWLGLLVPAPEPGNLSSVIDAINQASRIVTIVMLAGGAALVAGWALQVLSHLLARRRTA